MKRSLSTKWSTKKGVRIGDCSALGRYLWLRSLMKSRSSGIEERLYTVSLGVQGGSFRQRRRALRSNASMD